MKEAGDSGIVWQALCLSTQCLTWDALNRASKESVFSLLPAQGLAGNRSPGRDEPFKHSGSLSNHLLCGLCAWVYSVLETQMLFVSSSTLAPKTPG